MVTTTIKNTTLIRDMLLLVLSGLISGIWGGAYFILIPGVAFGFAMSVLLYLHGRVGFAQGLVLCSPVIYTGSLFIAEYLFGKVFYDMAVPVHDRFGLMPPEAAALEIGFTGSFLLAVFCSFFKVPTRYCLAVFICGFALSALFFDVDHPYYLCRAYPFVIWQVCIGLLIVYGAKGCVISEETS